MSAVLQRDVSHLFPCAKAILLIVAIGPDRLAARAGIPIADAREIVAIAQDDLCLMTIAVARARKS